MSGLAPDREGESVSGHWSDRPRPDQQKPLRRGDRRNHRARLMARVTRIARDTWRGGWNATTRRDPNWAAKSADHPDECTHICCQNERRWAKGDAKRTIQERRVYQRATDAA